MATGIACALELMVLLVLVWTSVAVMVGSLEPGEALRRVGVVLVLLLLVPVLIQSLIHSVVVLALTVVDVLKHATYTLVVAAVAVLIGWVAVQQIRKRLAGSKH
jgi:hypothetical protein